MTGSSTQPQQRAITAMISFLKREATVLFLLLKDNLNAAYFPVIILYIAMSSAVSCPTLSGLCSILLLALLFQMAFDTMNQLVGVEEDAINKPHRPIPSGLISVRGCIFRCIIANAAYLLVGALHGIAPWCALWQLASVGYLLRFDKNWFYKNHVFIPAGIVVQFMTGVCLANVGMYSQEFVQWVFTFSAYFGVCATVQDIRDVAGDMALKRRTVPVILGLERTRYVFMVVMGIFSPTVVRFVVLAPIWDTNYHAACWILAMHWPFHVLITYRLAAMKNAGDHRLTYTCIVWQFIISCSSMYYIAPSLLLITEIPVRQSFNQSLGRTNQPLINQNQLSDLQD